MSYKPRVLLQQPIFAPYRKAVFELLAESKSAEFSFAYGAARRGSALRSMDPLPGMKYVPLRNLFIGSGPTMTIQSGLTQAVRHGQYDAVILNFDPRIITNLMAAKVAKAKGTRVIWWGHGIRPRGRFQSIYQRLAHEAHAVILYTEAGRQGMEALGIPGKKLYVARNSIDIPRYQAHYRATPITERTSIVHIGRMIPVKKLPMLIDAFAQARQQGLRSDLILIGDGPEEAEVQTRISRYGLEDAVTLTGALFPTEDKDMARIADAFNRSWLSVSPGSVGLNILDSIAMGVPMLLNSDVPHNPEVEAAIEEKTAFWTSEAHFATKLVALEKQGSCFPGLHESCLEIANLYSPSAMADTFVKAVTSR